MHRRISEPYSPRQGNKKRADGTKNDKHHQMFADNKSQQDDTQDSEPCCTYWQNSNFALAHLPTPFLPKCEYAAEYAINRQKLQAGKNLSFPRA